VKNFSEVTFARISTTSYLSIHSTRFDACILQVNSRLRGYIHNLRGFDLSHTFNPKQLHLLLLFATKRFSVRGFASCNREKAVCSSSQVHERFRGYPPKAVDVHFCQGKPQIHWLTFEQIEHGAQQHNHNREAPIVVTANCFVDIFLSYLYRRRRNVNLQRTITLSRDIPTL
jgi:hypothetical protein